MLEPLNPYDKYDGEMPFFEEYDVETEEETEEMDEPANPVNVVYCKDCVWRDVDLDDLGQRGCHWNPNESPDDYDYCSAGERKDG